MVTLSILIPTYNRAQKLLRLLQEIYSQIIAENLGDQIKVLISDNASKDTTKEICIQYLVDKPNFQYFRQSSNLGPNLNFLFLFEQAKTHYIWFICDDDIPLPGAIAKVLSGLENYKPDVLLFSFIQPPGSKHRAFNFTNYYEIVRDPEQIIKLVWNPKASTYVMRRIELTPDIRRELEPHYESGYLFVDITYSVLGTSNNPTLCIISEALATCDEDYVKFEFTPGILTNTYKIFYHPFVLKHFPSLPEQFKDQSYCVEIQFLFAVKMGSLIVENIRIYDEAIEQMEYKLIPLLKNPRSFIQLFFMKNNLTNLYKKIKPAVALYRHLRGSILQKKTACYL